ITAGQSAIYTMALIRNNFTGSVSLSVSGLPNGATANITPNPTSNNSSTITINTGVGTDIGNYILTINGIATGATVTSTTVTLVVDLPPAVQISASPGTQTITTGESTNYNIMLDRTNYAGDIDLSLNGLPAGASASFSPAQTTGNSS